MHGANAGNEQCGHLGVFHSARYCLDPFDIGLQTEPVVEACPGQTVAMGNLDAVHAGFIECTGDRAHLIQGVLMAARVHAIAQGHVGDIDFVFRAHRILPGRLRRPAW